MAGEALLITYHMVTVMQRLQYEGSQARESLARLKGDNKVKTRDKGMETNPQREVCRGRGGE